MFTHILTLLWNTRRTRMLLAGQILLSFIVLFGVFGFVSQRIESYRVPLGFNVNETYTIDIELPEAIDTVRSDREEMSLRLKRELATVEGVEEVSLMGFIAPFDNSQWGWGEEVDGLRIWTRVMMVDEDFGATMQANLARGRWFTPADTIGGGLGIVVNEAWMERNFPETDMLDSTINFFRFEDEAPRDVKVVGVVSGFKYLGEFSDEEALTFVPDAPWDKGHESYWMEAAMVRVAPGTPASVEEDLFELVSAVTGSRESVTSWLETRRRDTSQESWVPILIMLSISAFLVLNVALGLFGVLINAIAKRRGEIGLRKALGATGAGVTTQLTVEVLLVAVLGLVLGGLLTTQLVYLDFIEFELRYIVLAAALAAGLILTLVLVCALIPSGQAARIHPAVALRED